MSPEELILRNAAEARLWEAVTGIGVAAIAIILLVMLVLACLGTWGRK